MEEKEYSNVYAIPANYTDSGKLLGGMVETRNAVEAVALVILVGYPELMWIPMPTTIRIVVMTVTLIPLAVVAFMGIDGDSLLQYLGHRVIIRLYRPPASVVKIHPPSMQLASRGHSEASVSSLKVAVMVTAPAGCVKL